MPAPSKTRNPRRGLQKLACDACGTSVYATWSAVENGPRPVCGGCLEPFIPEHPELAAAVCSPAELESHPWHVEFRRQASSVMHGQASHVQRGRAVRSPDVIAWERVERARREAAREAQLAPLQARAAAAAEEIPF